MMQNPFNIIGPILVALTIAGGGIGLFYAVTAESRPPQPVLLVEIVELPGDRFVECVRPLSGRGVACNWEAADAD